MIGLIGAVLLFQGRGGYKERRDGVGGWRGQIVQRWRSKRVEGRDYIEVVEVKVGGADSSLR